MYQYGERTLSSIRALRLLFVLWRSKGSTDLALLGFGYRTFRVKSSSLSVCIVNTGVTFAAQGNGELSVVSWRIRELSLSWISFSAEAVLPKFLAVVQRVSTHRRYYAPCQCAYSSSCSCRTIGGFRGSVEPDTFSAGEVVLIVSFVDNVYRPRSEC